MTRDEALKLKDGDAVLARYGSAWLPAIVRGEPWLDTYSQRAHGAWTWVARPGKSRNGKAYPEIMRHESGLRPAPPAGTANVYADFLDDAGHHEAAALLREAFPLGDRTP